MMAGGRGALPAWGAGAGGAGLAGLQGGLAASLLPLLAVEPALGLHCPQPRLSPIGVTWGLVVALGPAGGAGLAGGAGSAAAWLGTAGYGWAQLSKRLPSLAEGLGSRAQGVGGLVAVGLGDAAC